MREKLCFNRFVAFEKKEIVVGLKVGASTKRSLDRIVAEHDRTISYVARELLLRGLAAYEADGILRAADATPKADRQIAPVVATIHGGQPTKADVRRMIEQPEIDEIERRIKPNKRQTVPLLKEKAR